MRVKALKSFRYPDHSGDWVLAEEGSTPDVPEEQHKSLLAQKLIALLPKPKADTKKAD